MRSLDAQIAHLERKISDLAAKEAGYKNRRVRLEQKLNRLLKRRNARLDFLYVTALRKQIKDAPEELSKLEATLHDLNLSDEDRVLLGLPAKNTGSAGADSGPDAAGSAPRPSANGADPNAPGAQDPDGARAAPPDPATDAAEDKPASHADPVDGDAAPSQPKATRAEANVPKEPSPDALGAQDPHGTPPPLRTRLRTQRKTSLRRARAPSTRMLRRREPSRRPPGRTPPRSPATSLRRSSSNTLKALHGGSAAIPLFHPLSGTRFRGTSRALCGNNVSPRSESAHRLASDPYEVEAPVDFGAPRGGRASTVIPSFAPGVRECLARSRCNAGLHDGLRA